MPPRRDPTDLDPELRRLYRILLDHPGGIREYEVLEVLRGEAPLRGLDELELFRVHFLLFHHLYRLKAALESQARGSVEIHCLGIRLVPVRRSAPNPENLPTPPDPLAEYYLDLEHLRHTTRRDVTELLQWFWKRFRVHGRRDEALAVLELGPQASPLEIRRRYRKLVREHHPDRGGDPEAFCRIAEAMEVIRLHDTAPSV